MGRKDTCEKELVANDEIFADVVNSVVFSGKQIGELLGNKLPSFKPPCAAVFYSFISG